MSTAQHTAGPWVVFPGNYRASFVVPQSHVGRKLGGADDAIEDLAEYAQEICQIDDQHRHRKAAEQRANARLIAAAPELLNALLDCVALFDNEFKDWGVVKPELAVSIAAILKATGSEA